jgi:arsenate reductase
MRQKVLFICRQNASLSQMAEAFLNELCSASFEAQSAGFEPGELNPIVVEAMKEVGVDISRKQTKTVSELYQSGHCFAYVITLCDETKSQRVPIFPGITTRLHWSFRDPADYQGSHAYRLNRTGDIRDAVKAAIEAWCSRMCLASAAYQIGFKPFYSQKLNSPAEP